MRDALGERVEADEEQGGDGVGDDEGWKLHEDGEAGEELGGREHQSGAGRDGAAGKGPVARPGNVWVEIAVPEIVDCAAGAAHDEGASQEEKGRAENGERWGYGRCCVRGCKEGGE